MLQQLIQVRKYFIEKNILLFLFFKVLARVRVTLTDTVIRLEHLINNSDHGVALEVRIKKYESSKEDFILA